MLESDHVSTLEQTFNLQLNQPFNYFPHPFAHSEYNLDYHIFELQISLNACAHIPLML
jgi:hypothetical protein